MCCERRRLTSEYRTVKLNSTAVLKNREGMNGWEVVWMSELWGVTSSVVPPDETKIL